MYGLLTAADAAVAAAFITMAGGVIVALISQQRVERQLKPNGGSSLRDAVDRLERRAENVDRRAANLEQSSVDRDVRITKIESGVELLLDHAGIPKPKEPT